KGGGRRDAEGEAVDRPVAVEVDGDRGRVADAELDVGGRRRDAVVGAGGDVEPVGRVVPVAVGRGAAVVPAVGLGGGLRGREGQGGQREHQGRAPAEGAGEGESHRTSSHG